MDKADWKSGSIAVPIHATRREVRLNRYKDGAHHGTNYIIPETFPMLPKAG